MVHIRVHIILILFLKGINAKCPSLKLEGSQYMNTFSWNINYTLYQYISIPPVVKSPFYLSKKGIKMCVFRNNVIYSHCRFTNVHNYTQLDYVAVKLVAINGTRKLKVDYQDDEFKVFCNATYTMEEVYVIEYLSDKIITLYGCIDISTGRKPKRVEGLFIFIGYHKFNSQVINYTYKFLKEQTSLKVANLKTVSPEIMADDTCDDIKVLQEICKAPTLIEVLIYCSMLLIWLIVFLGILMCSHKFFKQFTRKI